MVDTGVDYNQADLQPLGVGSFSAFAGTAQDTNGHGTHIAGTIAARNNATDVAVSLLRNISRSPVYSIVVNVPLSSIVLSMVKLTYARRSIPNGVAVTSSMVHRPSASNTSS